MNKFLAKRSGIYEIKNTETSDTYIGSSQDIAERWRRHKRDLRKGKHHSRFLQRSWNKYGENVFTFIVLEFCPTIDELPRVETAYLLFNLPTYNTDFEAGSSRGRKLSQETKDKISATIRRLGRIPPESTWKSRQKRIVAIDPKSDKVIKIFDSIAAACRYMGRDHTFVTMLSRCANGKAKSGLAWGLKWEWALFAEENGVILPELG